MDAPDLPFDLASGFFGADITLLLSLRAPPGRGLAVNCPLTATGACAWHSGHAERSYGIHHTVFMLQQSQLRLRSQFRARLHTAPLQHDASWIVRQSTKNIFREGWCLQYSTPTSAAHVPNAPHTVRTRCANRLPSACRCTACSDTQILGDGMSITHTYMNAVNGRCLLPTYSTGSLYAVMIIRSRRQKQFRHPAGLQVRFDITHSNTLKL